MERALLFPIAALIMQAAVQACPSPQLAHSDVATSPVSLPAATQAAKDRRLGPSGFEENKGQVKQTDGQSAPYVKFRLSDGNTKIFLLERGIAYQFNRVHDPEGYAELAHRGHLSSEDETKLNDLRKQRRLETYRMDMTLEGADPHASITTEGRSTDFTNYYLSGVEALDVHSFSKIVYHGVYPGIDWEIMTTEKGFEHDFIVHPGADPSSIKIRFAGHEELFVDAGEQLVHGNRLGRFVEEGPVSYQGMAKVRTAFVLRGSLLAFKVGDFERTQDLRIDPVRLWATYYGGEEVLGENAEGLSGVVLDENANVYCVGWTSASNDIATLGSQDTTFAGQGDGIAVKFDAQGIRKWGTYYGGTNSDYFASCALSGGNLFTVGNTNTASDMATTHQVSHGGSYDGLIVDFDTADGTRIWASYYGGLLEDRINYCSVSQSGQLYVCGNTLSSSPYFSIASEGSPHQVTPNHNGWQGFLAKFDSIGQRLWGTYFGNDNWTEAWGVANDPDGNVYLAGGAGNYVNAAFEFSVATPGSHQQSSRGPDAYLAKFDSGGVMEWGTFYGGDTVDWGWGCSTDLDGNVFLIGDSYSYGPAFSIDTLGFQSDHGGGNEEDAFVVKFNSEGVRQWGTYYGTDSNDVARGCTTDVDGNIYMIGTTSSTNGISFNGHQNLFAGNEDGYLVKFGPDGTRLWATYYGGVEFDNAQTAAVDGLGNIYMCGRTYSSSGISTTDAHDTVLTGQQDGYLVKFGDYTDCEGVLNGPSVVGAVCDDGDVCTNDDMWTVTCSCAGTEWEVHFEIDGNSLLASGTEYTFTVDPLVPGVVYNWVVPDGWASSGSPADIITVTPPFNGGVDSICVSGTQGICELIGSCISVVVLPVGMTVVSNSATISVQPNPNNGRFELVRKTAATGIIRYELLDATGRAIGRSGSITGLRTALDLGEASSGVYFVRLQHDSGTDVLRLVVQH